MNDPKLVLFDEPTTGFDPQSRRKLYQYLKNNGTTALIVTQSLNDVEEYCDKVAVLMNGSLMEYGTMKQVFFKYKAGYTLKIFPFYENANEENEDEEERKSEFEAGSNGRYYSIIDINRNAQQSVIDDQLKATMKRMLPFCKMISEDSKEYSLHELTWPNFDGSNPPLIFNFEPAK